ncbi:DUF3221 domain-containing protein [Lentibacillus sp. N15]|uniref:DUF3221 domain-containing protein n=1 Tax=Lentibacillus songyuanensis TaxID=3136161 RepID=UPI0031BA3F0E
MKRVFIFAIILILFVFLTDFLNARSANDNATVDGYLLNKDGMIYLVTADDFNIEKAEKMSMKQFIFEYTGDIHILNRQGRTKHGDKVRIWYDYPVLESYPAKLNVLKIKKL